VCRETLPRRRFLASPRVFAILAVVSSVAATAAGCSVFFDPRGYSEGPTSPPADGAAADDHSAPNTTDASSGAPETGAPRSGLCQSLPPAAFCADFDAPDARPSTFGTSQVMETGSVDLATDATPPSSPRSLRTAASGTNARASLIANVMTTSKATSIGLDLDLRIATWGTSYAQLTQLVFGEQDLCLVRLVGNQTHFAVVEACYTNGAESGKLIEDTTRTFDPGTWHHFALTVSLALPGSIQLEIDGTPAIPPMSILPEFRPATLTLELGVELVPSGSVVLDTDNVLLTAH
jgi:hypothetical protein